jgi:hypothetical protein
MSFTLAALSSTVLYIFTCTGAADGITEVRIQNDFLSYNRNDFFSIVAMPPMKSEGESDLWWTGPEFPYEGRVLKFHIGREPDKLTIQNSWDGSTVGHEEGESTIADVCVRAKHKGQAGVFKIF